jgi:hypothetical protein
LKHFVERLRPVFDDGHFCGAFTNGAKNLNPHSTKQAAEPEERKEQPQPPKQEG